MTLLERGGDSGGGSPFAEYLYNSSSNGLKEEALSPVVVVVVVVFQYPCA